MLVRTKTLEPFNAFIDSSTRSKLLSSPIILTKTVLLLFVIFSFWVTNLFALFYFPNKFLYYGFVVPSLAFLSRALCFCLGIVWVRTKNFPTTFPLITISNHLSFADSPLLFFLLECRFVAKSGVQRIPVFGALAKTLRAIFVERTDTNSRKTASLLLNQVLDENIDSVHLFVEGCCSGFVRGKTALLQFCEGPFRKQRTLGLLKITYKTLGGPFCWDAESPSEALVMLQRMAIVEVEYLGTLHKDKSESDYLDKTNSERWRERVYSEMVRLGNFIPSNMTKFDMLIIRESVLDGKSLFKDYVLFSELKKKLPTLEVSELLALVSKYKTLTRNKKQTISTRSTFHNNLLDFILTCLDRSHQYFSIK